jgi:hypothetical protein
LTDLLDRPGAPHRCECGHYKIVSPLAQYAVAGMARLNIAPHVVDRILNHVSGTIRGVAAVYNRHAYFEERKSALEAWRRYVESLVRPASPNVLSLIATR